MNSLLILLSAAPDQPGLMPNIMMIGAIILVFYFFMIRPQLRRSKELKKFRSELKKGDKVLTIGGIHGKVVEVNDNYVLIEVDNNVKLRVSPSAIVKDAADLQQTK